MNGFTVRETDPERVEAVRQNLGLADDEVMLLFVGWMYTFSGLREIARKLVESDRYARYRLVIAGDGDLFAELKELSQRSSRGDRLVLLGKVPREQIADLIGAADVGLCSSNQTPAMRYVVPSKVDEYLELGRPVVATRLPGLLAELGGEDGRLAANSLASAQVWLATIVGPAVFDAVRYYKPDAAWARWASRAAKIGGALMIVRAAG